MRPSFIPTLVNGLLFDPVVYVRILNENRAVMFDCGRIEGLSNRQILSIEAIFISHTHMDHFIGIDSVLRIILHRNIPMRIYGPEGITDKMLSKLNAYTWNLTGEYTLEVIIHEVRPESIMVTRTEARTGFGISTQDVCSRQGYAIAQTRRYCVEAVILDHGIACLGFVLKEPFHINILSDVLTKKGYIPGAWIGRLKEMILSGHTDGSIEVTTSTGDSEEAVKDLMEELVIITPGQKIGYFTDIGYCRENIDRIGKIARDVDILFIESYYLEELRDQAYAKGHLTALQAGLLARRLGAKRVFPMHVSPRYHHMVEEILKEVGITP